jgi:hypothetical protein
MASKASGVCMDGSRVFAGETSQLIASLSEWSKEAHELDSHVHALKAAADGSAKPVCCLCLM